MLNPIRFIGKLWWRLGILVASCFVAVIVFVQYSHKERPANVSCSVLHGNLEEAFSFKDNNNNIGNNNNNNSNNNSKKKKLILLYSTWFDRPCWESFKGGLLRSEFTNCPYSKDCIATYNKSLINVADALLFHGRDIESNRNYRATILQDLRKTVPKKQKWIFLSQETPRNANLYEPYNGIFNWTATFRRDSDVFIPYTRHIKFDKPKENVKVNYAKGKTRLVAWAVSNYRKTRHDYALELQRYVDLKVFGGCGKYFKNHGDCKREKQAAVNVPSCAKEMASYKFYLAFENAFCQDWVSEKYWRTMKQNVVPVVMGANYDEGAAIPGSFIDVNDFNSVKELADYLLYLDKNDDEYDKYFAWKTQYGFLGESMYCSICQELNSEKFQKTSQVVLSEVYSEKNNCGKYRYREAKIKRLSRESRHQWHWFWN